MSSATAKNLAAIHKAILRHNGNCGEPITAILLNPFEVERLGFDDFEGIPIQGDDQIGTGRFRLVCAGQHDDPEREAAEEREVVNAVAGPTPEVA